jgi:hypothetical protein
LYKGSYRQDEERNEASGIDWCWTVEGLGIQFGLYSEGPRKTLVSNREG